MINLFFFFLINKVILYQTLTYSDIFVIHTNLLNSTFVINHSLIKWVNVNKFTNTVKNYNYFYKIIFIKFVIYIPQNFLFYGKIFI